MIEKYIIYPAKFTQEDDGFDVCFEDFKASTFGDNFAHALHMAEELLGGLAMFYDEEKLQLPSPTNIKKVICNDNQFANLIAVDLNNYKTFIKKGVKRTFFIPKDLFLKAKEKDVDLSKFFINALTESLV